MSMGTQQERSRARFERRDLPPHSDRTETCTTWVVAKIKAALGAVGTLGKEDFGRGGSGRDWQGTPTIRDLKTRRLGQQEKGKGSQAGRTARAKAQSGDRAGNPGPAPGSNLLADAVLKGPLTSSGLCLC